MTETIKDNSQQHTGNWVEDIRKGAETNARSERRRADSRVKKPLTR